MSGGVTLLDKAREMDGLISEPHGSETANGGWASPEKLDTKLRRI